MEPKEIQKESEDGEEQSSSSKWNEQQAFAEIYFQLSSSCRVAQIDSDYERWFNTIIGKIVHIRGVASEIEDDKLKQVIVGLSKSREVYTSSYNCNAPNLKMVRGNYFTDLINSEGIVDKIAHSHMPFLNLKKRVDIGGL